MTLQQLVKNVTTGFVQGHIYGPNNDIELIIKSLWALSPKCRFCYCIRPSQMAENLQLEGDLGGYICTVHWDLFEAIRYDAKT